MEFKLPIKVFDFFSGCGGTCRGFQNAGMDIICAIDNDPFAAKTFRHNFPSAHFLEQDIHNIQRDTLKNLIEECEGHPILFSACAPCQPFTRQKTKRRNSEDRDRLLIEFLRFFEHYKAEFVFIENVPGMQKVDNEEGPFQELLKVLKRLGYQFKFDIVASQSYGVPQIRRRLILIASRLGVIDFPAKTHGPAAGRDFSTVGDWIRDLPPIAAGETHPNIPNHRAASLSQINLQRIKALHEGQDRRQWAKRLRLKCHSNGYKGHTDVYGRMRWSAPATGLTTRCISLSNGRFGHPEQDRAISAREAACLQTFPNDFIFKGNLNETARQIGNAVPVLLAEQFGRNFVQHLQHLIDSQRS